MDEELLEVESSSSSGGLRRLRPLKGSFRYYPYTTWKKSSMKEEDMKEEVVRLGVELSLSVAKSMFLLCDDIHTMLWFCFKLWRGVIPYRNPVLDRLLLVIHFVYSRDIKPKGGVFHDGGKSVQWELIRTSFKDFGHGIVILHRLEKLVRRKGSSFDDRLLSSAVVKYKQQVLKNLECKLRSAEDVSEANGFARETLESHIFDLWKSLFDEEEEEDKATCKVMRSRILSDLFTPLLGKPGNCEILALSMCSPYILGEDFAVQILKEEVVRLGVELSLHVAQSMLLLCDDIRTMLEFCSKLWSGVIPHQSPVLERLLHVIHYVYSKDIKPRKNVVVVVYEDDCGNSVKWELIRTTWKHFADGVIILDRLDMALRRKVWPFDGPQLWAAVEKYKQQVLEKLEGKLRDVNGFGRETIESDILDLWKSLFAEEAKEDKEAAQVVRSRMRSDLFTPLLGKPLRSEILTLPVSSPYILGKDFENQEAREEVVRLGVELSLHVAQSMFLLCDDIRSLLLFCYGLWRDAVQIVPRDSPVAERLLLVMHHVYTKDIKPKNGSYQNDGNKSVQWKLIRTTRESLNSGFRSLDRLVSFLKAGGSCGRVLTSRVEDKVRNVEDKLWRVRAVSEGNGFARNVMESNVLDLWKSLFDKEAKEATLTLKVIKNGLLRDLFLPLFNQNQAPPPP